MAGRDKTGPQGMGPMTGRGMGSCADYDGPEIPADAARGGGGRGRGWRARDGRGRNAGFGQGRGRGFGYGWRRAENELPKELAAAPALSSLAQEVADLRVQLAALTAKISEKE